MKVKRYTESDYEFICRHYNYLTAEEIAHEIGRTSRAIVSTVKRLRENGKFEVYHRETPLQIKPKKIRSGVRGIYWRADIQKWLVTPSRDKKTYYLGCYADLEEAKDVLEEFKYTYDREDDDE